MARQLLEDPDVTFVESDIDGGEDLSNQADDDGD